MHTAPAERSAGAVLRADSAPFPALRFWARLEPGTPGALAGRAAAMFADDGGRALVGTNVLACHPEKAPAQLEGMLASGKQNVYTIEKRGVKKLIYQSPWCRAGVYAGFVELSLEISAELPHFVRAG